MRYANYIRSRLTEAVAHSFVTRRASKSSQVDVYVNPSKREMNQLAYREGVGSMQCRMWLVGIDAYAWNPFVAVHNEVKSEMRFPDTAIPLFVYFDAKEAAVSVTDATRHTPLHGSPTVKAEVESHPIWKSLRLRVIDLDYYDQDVRGAWHDQSETDS